MRSSCARIGFAVRTIALVSFRNALASCQRIEMQNTFRAEAPTFHWASEQKVATGRRVW